MKKYISIICVLISILQITATNTDTILIGDQIEVIVEQNKNENIIIKNLSKNIDIISNHSDTIYKNNTTKIVQKLIITSFDTGLYIINQNYPNLDFNHKQIYVKTIPVNLEEDIKDITDIKDIKDIKDIRGIKTPKEKIILYIVIIILIIIILYTILKLYNKKQSIKKEIVKKEIITSPYQTAINMLDELQKSNLIKNKKYKLFYSIISEVLRKYIEGVFKIPAMENPTQEIIIKIRKTINKPVTAILKNILSKADLIKYAKAITNEKESLNNLKQAYKFINMTTKKNDK